MGFCCHIQLKHVFYTVINRGVPNRILPLPVVALAGGAIGVAHSQPAQP
uniref:Uncharacterized protein n=1 Tax=Anguilla anguilla TaxID=7936 RepID=A0A0E9VUH8_ANGAN